MGSLGLHIILIFLISHSYVDSYPLDNSDFIWPNIAIEPSEFAGRMLMKWSETEHAGNPEEQGPYFEGDIIFPNARASSNRPARKWKQRIIPYEITGSFTEDQKAMIKNAIDEIVSRTCIKLIPHNDEKDYIVFKNDGSGCWSAVGRNGGPQFINLQAPCLKVVGTAIHEILHAIGLYHEQNRSDRDDYVTVINKNIKKDKLVNFKKLMPNIYDTQNVLYDYKSVLHYSPNAFSINGKKTIETKGDPVTRKLMGQRKGLSEGDIMKVNRMYNCLNI